jgi:plasmid stability protein
MVIFRMVDLLIRGVPDTVMAALEKRAAANGRDAESEVCAIIEQNLKPKDEGFWERAQKLRAELRGRKFTPSEDLIRESRDER